MRSTTLFALCPALPLIVALSIDFYVPEQWKDTAIVEGKKTSDGDIETMSRGTPDSRSPDDGFCAGLDGVWQYDHDPLCDAKYYGFISIDFRGPTTDPRPVNVTLGADRHEVSQRKPCRKSN